MSVTHGHLARQDPLHLAPWIFPALTDEAKPLNAALRNIRLQDLRHTYASLLLQAGEPIA
jgi:integrase